MPTAHTRTGGGTLKHRAKPGTWTGAAAGERPPKGVPMGPDGRPRFVRAPKEYRSAGRRAEKLLALLTELESLDTTPARNNAARALLAQARIRQTLYGPTSDATW